MPDLGKAEKGQVAGYYLNNTVGERASLQMGVPKHTRRRGRKGCVEGWEGERRTEAERSLKPAWARGKRQEPLSAQCQLLV